MLFVLPVAITAEIIMAARNTITAVSITVAFMSLSFEYRYRNEAMMKIFTIIRFRLTKALSQTNGLMNMNPRITGHTILSKVLCFVVIDCRLWLNANSR